MTPSPATASQHPVAPHFHFDDHCPFCEQEIPPDRLEEVQGRIAVRAREQAAEATALLREQHTRDRAQADAKAKAELEDVRAEAAAALERQKQETAAREQVIREEDARKSEALLKERLAEAETRRAEQEDALTARAAEAERMAQQATDAQAALKAEMAQIRQAGDEALAQEKLAWGDREAALKAEAKSAADAEKAQLAEDLNARVADALKAKQAAEQQAEALQQGHETAIAARVQEAREALEKDKSEALLAKDQTHFAERQRLEAIVDDLKRKLDNQKSGELGEGAEIKLFDVLKEAYPDDRIRRVDKGAPGADIVHEVMLNGKVAGRIVYDSKNRGAWQTAFATKLRQDQIAAGADHAILSTNKFPKDTRELHMQDGVIIVCPARAVVLAGILRNHILETHELRMSNDERSAKTERLYAFITSNQCRQLIESIETLIGRLEQIDTDELKAHRTVWLKRGELLKQVLKANADFRFTLDGIIGTADATE